MMQDNILSIVMFGSTARAEEDAYSDVDVCVITRETTNESEIETIKSIINDDYCLQDVEIVVYSADQFEAMNAYGSLFLWHLKLEGKVLFDRNYFGQVMKRLSVYENHLCELDFHADLLKDVEFSMERLHIVNELDLSQLFTICRNTCMILSHFNQEFAFGRKSAFQSAKRIYNDLPLTEEEYSYLSKWKLRYERSLFDDLELPSIGDVEFLLKKSKELIYFAVGKVSHV